MKVWRLCWSQYLWFAAQSLFTISCPSWHTNICEDWKFWGKHHASTKILPPVCFDAFSDYCIVLFMLGFGSFWWHSERGRWHHYFSRRPGNWPSSRKRKF